MKANARVLDFLGERAAATTSWERADPQQALIEQDTLSVQYTVCLHGGNAHTVQLWRRGIQWVGRCDCDGFRYHDGPCAHLCAVWRAAATNTSTATGKVLSLPPRQPEDPADGTDGREQPGTDLARRLGCGRRPARPRASGGARDPPRNRARGGTITHWLSRRRTAIHHVITPIHRDYVRGGVWT